MITPIKAVFFDYDGVLCSDYFYENLRDSYPLVWDYKNRVIFGGEQKYSDRWMRGEFSYHEINRMISAATGISFPLLEKLFIASVHAMTINQELLEFAVKLKQIGVPIALVSNNMDVFNEVTIPVNHLDRIFPVIINSCDHGALKHEQNGKLFDLTLARLRLTSFDNILLIDNSSKSCDMFESKGGRVHRFTNMENFRNWEKSSASLPFSHY
jgi:FMN phosphatase YigB (HAD superfamily)